MSKGNLLVCNANIVIDDEIIVGDLRIEAGIIKQIAKGGGLEPNEGEFFVDGTGLHLLPGMIDPQVHFVEIMDNLKRKIFTVVASLQLAVE